MASFTDLIPQFNPYIQQLPVEAMVKVGMEKQKRYDEGVQKIQSQIDNIAGLDVVRDIDKAYLQSKLNELGNNLKTVAAGDFSNFQLVNSVAGMTNQIVKDRNVVNALSSTQAYRKGLNDMATFNKEGKGSPSNDWDFKDRASKWLNSKSLDDTFNGTYNPYTNYKKNALEVIKSLTKDSSIRDDAFRIDSKGNLVIQDAILREKMAGISPEKIQQALLAGLTPSDWKQMEIDGRYSYANLDGEQFVKSVNSSYKNKYDSFAQQRNVLENAKSSTSSAVEKAQLDRKIKDLDKILNNISTEYGNISKTFASGDIDSAKARLFTSDFMNGFSNAFSFTETSQTYENNPLAQIALEREKKEQDWKKFLLDYDLSKKNLSLREQELFEKKEENRLKRTELEGYGGLPGPVDPNTLPKVVLGTVVNQTENYSSAIAKSDADFAASKGKDQAWLNQQREAYLRSPNGVDPVVKQHFDNTERLRRVAEENKVMIGKISSEADRVYGDVYSGIPKNAPNLNYTDNKGNRFTYTPKDLVDFNSKINNYKIVSSAEAGGRANVTFDDNRAKNELSQKEYRLYEAEKARFLGKGFTQADKVLTDNLNYYSKNVNVKYNDVLKKKNEFIEEEVKRRVLSAQGVSYNIPTTTKAQKESLSSLFGKVADLADSQKGAIAESPSLNKDILRGISEGGDAEGSVTIIEGTEFSPPIYQITARGKAGTTTFNMTPEQKYAMFGDRFEPSPAVRAFRPYQRMMQKFSDPNSSFLSTNPTKGDITYQNSNLKAIDFPNIRSYGVTGAVISNDGGRTYSLRLNMYDPITKTYHNDIGYPRMLSEEEVVPIMSQLTDAAIHELLNDGRQATRNDLQLLEKASKKPL
jgi:hypothetical protein